MRKYGEYMKNKVNIWENMVNIWEDRVNIWDNIERETWDKEEELEERWDEIRNIMLLNNDSWANKLHEITNKYINIITFCEFKY